MSYGHADMPGVVHLGPLSMRADGRFRVLCMGDTLHDADTAIPTSAAASDATCLDCMATLCDLTHLYSDDAGRVWAHWMFGCDPERCPWERAYRRGARGAA